MELDTLNQTEAETYYTIQQNLKQMLDQQTALRIMVKAAGYMDTVLNVIPKVILYMTKDETGLSLLEELGIGSKISELTTDQSTE